MLFTVKNLHRGNNKINWTKTISHSSAFMQENGAPVYLKLVNKKRIVNYEEELFVIYYSILNYLNEEYGFQTPINIQYELITGKQFKEYLKGMGKMRLMQIKYKYFRTRRCSFGICAMPSSRTLIASPSMRMPRNIFLPRISISFRSYDR